jgi:hypothetical protein
MSSSDNANKYDQELTDILVTAERDLQEVEAQLVRIREAKIQQIKASAKDKWTLVNMSRIVITDNGVDAALHQLSFEEAFALLEQKPPEEPKQIEPTKAFSQRPGVSLVRTNGHAQ